MTMFSNLLRIVALSLVVAGGAIGATSSVVYAATFTIVNNDGAGEGFNDTTPASPVGGNSGTTIGAQRLIAFQYAGDIWAARLTSTIAIRVQAQFNPLSCSASSGVLGSAGPTTVHRDYAGAPVSNTWYVGALANSLAGSDLSTNNDINATFNSELGTPSCLSSSGWYYGLDASSPGNRIDFVTVLEHELGHGLGFLSLVNLGTGAKLLSRDDAYMRLLERHGGSPSDYPSMTNAQRVAASTATGNLHWTGTNVRAASGVLTSGRVGDHVRMYAPNPARSGSSVSHFDTALTPNQLMEPSFTVPLHDPELEMPLFKDIGWVTVPVGGNNPVLAVTPSAGYTATGPFGGPFSPASKTYTLRNSGTGTLNWTASENLNGMSVSPTSGSLSANATTTITVSVNSAANTRPIGTHNATLTLDAVNGSGDTTRSLVLLVQSSGGPVNDDFADALTLNGNTGSTTGTNVNATTESGEPSATGTGPNHSVWWKWTAPASGLTTIDTNGSDFDTELGVYTGSSVGSLTKNTSNDDGGTGTASLVTFAATAGTTYRIQVEGFQSNIGAIVLNWLQSGGGGSATIVSAVLPTARSGQIGTNLSAFAAIVNASTTTTATGCSLALPSGVAATFNYQATVNNIPVGSPNTPVNIAPGAAQGYVFGVTPSAAMSGQEIPVVFDCTNTVPATSSSGVNTFTVSASSTPTPDMIAISATPNNNSIVDIPGTTGTGFFTTAAINVGITGVITATPDDNGVNLPANYFICQTNSAGNCITGFGASATSTVTAGQMATYTILIQGTGNIAFNPGVNRVLLSLTSGGVLRGQTAVAVRTMSAAVAMSKLGKTAGLK